MQVWGKKLIKQTNWVKWAKQQGTGRLWCRGGMINAD